ncbi:MAG: YqhA family protein [Casimicrobiaceae bacterium]
MTNPRIPRDPRMQLLPRFIFMSRWLQVPLYLGLIVAQLVYVWQFWVELVHLVEAAMGSSDALEVIRTSVAVPGADPAFAKAMSRETLTMLLVLGLIDVVMISNLLIMVIVGGYETFVSRMRLEDHPDQPEWLSHVNASVLKVKLATAIIGISSIHLLRTFINAEAFSEKALLYQTVIHITFLLSALAIAGVDRLMPAARSHRAIAHDAAVDVPKELL